MRKNLEVPEQKYWYKIVELDRKGNTKTLFHGLNGSRILTKGAWLVADIKPVKDGTSKTTYLSGWHIVPSEEECIDYLTFFKHQENKAIIRCRARNIWPKVHSRHNVFLSEQVFIED